MSTDGTPATGMEQLLETPDLARALGNEKFKQFLDHLPVAIAVSELEPTESIVYANLEFERLTGRVMAVVVGQPWSVLADVVHRQGAERPLSQVIAEQRDYLGEFAITRDDAQASIDAWGNLIEDDEELPVFRLVVLVERSGTAGIADAELEKQLQEKDTLLLELQHRVKNNLQMITALIRAEARGVPENLAGDRFTRLTGRIEALGLLYRTLSESGAVQSVDLGAYLSQIASAVMRVHAVEGVHLNLQADSWPVSIDVAMPAGLVVNELLTNALKHAFEGREGGTITLHSLVGPGGCRVVVSDDGVGLPPGAVWPRPGKLSALIVRSLLQNAKAELEVTSSPGQGMEVAIFFAKAGAAPATA